MHQLVNSPAPRRGAPPPVSIIADRPRLSTRKRLILATDLDGTLLGGTEQQRTHLYEVLRSLRDQLLLIYVTGRGLEGVMPLLAMPELPPPDLIICDVGATVVYGDDLTPVQPLQNHIAQRWPGTHAIAEAFADESGLHRQMVPQERRCSYYANAADVGAHIHAKAKALACDAIFSANRYLDILPQGVNKGSTLIELVAALQLPGDAVLTAGDTLNDLTLLQTPFRGVVVGNAEPALVAALAGHRERLCFAKAPGAGGILEALRHFGIIDATEHQRAKPYAALPVATPELVVLYHRQPFQQETGRDTIAFRHHESPNGIIPTLLGLFRHGQRGAWIAWQEARTREATLAPIAIAIDAHGHADPNAAERPLALERIGLTKADIDLFYKRFAKEALWPVLFSFPGRVRFERAHWEHFLEMNRLFAERTAAVAKPGATVWLHDYNLWMVPAMLRPRRPDLTLAFFHHTAFPPADIFNILPWARDIVFSLMQCDYVGFHIPRYVENFVDVARAKTGAQVAARTPSAPRFLTYGCALGVPDMATALRFAGHTVQLGAHPVGIDTERITQILATPDAQRRVAAIRGELADRQCILSVERLDYVKGPIEKLRAYRELLHRHPELRGRVVLVSICTPAAPGMEIYQGTRRQVDELVGQINGEFSSVHWTPIRYFYRSLPFEEVAAYYAASDVAWITPLRDGLNLVAKEFVTAQAAVGRHGVLVLSQFAGAAAELHGALLTNPYDTEDLTTTLRQALRLDPLDRQLRAERLAAIVAANDVRAWGETFLAAARENRRPVEDPDGLS